MSTPADAGSGPGKPGPVLGDIVEEASAAHRAWLEPMRTAYFDSKLSTKEISEKSQCSSGVKRLASKGKVSELLRGAGEYPRWYRVLALHDVLAPPMPLHELMELWAKGARSADRSPDWIEKCFADARREASMVAVKGKAGRATAGGAGLAPGTAMIVTLIIAVLTGLGGVLLGSSTVPQPPEAGATHATCGSGESCVGVETRGSSGNDRSSYYVRYPSPSDTHGMLEIVPSEDVKVYSGDGHEAVRGWVEAGDAFYVKCRTDRDLVVAGTGDRVNAGQVILNMDVSVGSIEALPRCPSLLGQPSPSPSPWK